MTDFFINPTPLPVPRPSGLFSEYEPSIDAEMPLEASRKAADAFSGVGSYPPTGEDIKLTSELLNQSSGILPFLTTLALVGVFIAILYRNEIWKFIVGTRIYSTLSQIWKT